jgi:hypothetical protein
MKWRACGCSNQDWPLFRMDQSRKQICWCHNRCISADSGASRPEPGRTRKARAANQWVISETTSLRCKVWCTCSRFIVWILHLPTLWPHENRHDAKFAYSQEELQRPRSRSRVGMPNENTICQLPIAIYRQSLPQKF